MQNFVFLKTNKNKNNNNNNNKTEKKRGIFNYLSVD